MCPKVVFVLYFIVVPSSCSRILGIVTTPSYSHQVVFRPLWKELSLRGHELTVLTTNPMNDPTYRNLTEIDLSFSYELWNKKILELIPTSSFAIPAMFDSFVTLYEALTHYQLQHPEVQELLRNESKHFDLVIVELMFPTMYAFSERFKCPLIGMLSFDLSAPAYDAVGNPTHPILNPELVLSFVGKQTFIERVQSVLMALYVRHYVSTYVYPIAQAVIETYFGNNYPYVEDIARNVSMYFVNTDPILHPIRPLVPAVIQIGSGIHLTPPKPLPKDLQRILDEASQGFIYFSLGGNIKSKDLPSDMMNILIEAFSELPYLVLWKFELEELPGKPENVIISKWFPQQGVLRHPNIKLFITQGGQQSMEEAINYHVPLVGVPFLADQVTNVKQVVFKGMGLLVDHSTISKGSFKATILEVITNSRYRNTVKKLAELSKDQPMTGLERAVWWTEYVLRHKGARHLRSPALDLPLYQYFLVDVCLVLIAVIWALIMVLIVCFMLIFKNVRLDRAKSVWRCLNYYVTNTYERVHAVRIFMCLIYNVLRFIFIFLEYVMWGIFAIPIIVVKFTFKNVVQCTSMIFSIPRKFMDILSMITKKRIKMAMRWLKKAIRTCFTDIKIICLLVIFFAIYSIHQNDNTPEERIKYFRS